MFRQLTRLGLAFLVFASLTGLSVAQGSSDPRVANHYGYRTGYADGFQQGREDRQTGKSYDFHSGDYDNAMRGYQSYMGSREGYKEGYRRGFVAGYNDGFRGHGARFMDPYGSSPRNNYGDQDDYDPAPAYGPAPGYDHQSEAFRIGYRDGMIAGGKDRSKNKKFRPTKNDKYEDADHGYTHDYGNKKEYKREYRDGFVAGYERGYGSLRSDGNGRR